MKFIHLSPIRKDVSGISEADQLVEHLVVLEGVYYGGRHQLDGVEDELAHGAGLLSLFRNSGSTLTAIY